MPRTLSNSIPFWRWEPRVLALRNVTCTLPSTQKQAPLLEVSIGAHYHVRATQIERRVAPRSPTFLLVAAACGSAPSRPCAQRRTLSGCVDSGESGHVLGLHFVSLGCCPGSSSPGLNVGKKKAVQSPRSTLHLHDMNPIPFVNLGAFYYRRHAGGMSRRGRGRDPSRSARLSAFITCPSPMC
jgi:hypothetical protein